MPLTLQQRLLALSPRERKFLGIGVLAVLLFLIFMLLPDTDDPADEEGVEIVEAPPPAAAPPPPAPTVSYAPAPSLPPAAPAASASGVVLKSVLSTGAILFIPPSTERLVRIGREFMPGMTLKSVSVRHAIVGGPGGDFQIELGKAGSTPVQSVVAAAGPASTSPGVDYRSGLQRVRTPRIRGYEIKPGTAAAPLRLAGMEPGDVIVSVNGSDMDEEMVANLSQLAAGSEPLEFEFVRGGRRMSVVMKPGAR